MSIAQKIAAISENEQRVYDAGVEKGKKAEYDKFWDSYTNYGLFGGRNMFSSNGWNDSTFYPKYDITLDFQAFTECTVTDLEKRLKDCNVKIKKITSLYQVFYGSSIRVIPYLDLSNLKTSTDLTNAFRNCYSLHTIRGLKLSENNFQYNDTFYGCQSLKNIAFEGVCAKSINLSWSPLTIESAMSLINILKDYSGTANANKYKVSFSSATWGYLDAEGNASPNSTTWREYINSLGWNC